MVGIKEDYQFLKTFFLEKKKRFAFVLGIFVSLLYLFIGILTISTTRTLSYVLDFSGWMNYLIKLPLQLPHRMNDLGIFFLVATLMVFSVYLVLAFTSFGEKAKHLKVTSYVGFMTLLGLGCASCGAFVLASLLGIFGATSLLAFLPLHGGEFQIMAFVISLGSLQVLIRKMQVTTCDIKDVS